MSRATQLYLNDTRVVAAGTTLPFSVEIPAGGFGRLLTSTRRLRPESDRIKISNVEILPLRFSRPVKILDGTPNIKEWCGRGRAPRVFPVKEITEDDSEIVFEITNEDSDPIEVSVTHVLELLDVAEGVPAKDPEGNAKIINVTKTLAAAAEDNFVFVIPSGNIGKWKDITGFLRDTVTQETGELDVTVKNIAVIFEGETQKTSILTETMDFHELVGDAELTRLVEVLTKLRSNSELVVRIRNDEANPVEVSTTMWFANAPVALEGRRLQTEEEIEAAAHQQERGMGRR